MARNKMLSRYILLGLSSTFLFAWEGDKHSLPMNCQLTIPSR